MLYDEDTYQAYMETFDTLPVSAIVNGQYLCMHGGISPKLTSLSAINKVDRMREPPEEGLVTDMLWADPAKRSQANRIDWQFNEDRNISYIFGARPLAKLLEKERLKSIVRAH